MDFSDEEVLPAAKKAARREKEKRMARKDKLSLRVEDDDDESEDDLDEPVYDIKGGGDYSEEDEDAEYEYDDEEEDDDLDEAELTGLAAKMAKQAKYLKRKASAVGLEDDDDEEERDEEEGKKAVWGKKKQAYYSGDNVDYELQSSDEEEPLEEEEEALRLQRKAASSLRPEDFGHGEDEEDEDDQETLQDSVRRLENGGSASKKQKKKGSEARKKGKQGGFQGASAVDGDMAVERVAKDVNALSKEEQMAVIMSEAPELVGLLSELKEGLAEAKTKVQPLLEKVKAGDHATAEGISYLETKHLLLLSYCQCIMFYLLLKAEGRSVRDHPVIARLVEMRLFLEKLRPIDKKLQYQIEKLLKAANEAVEDDDEDADGAGSRGAKGAALSFRPNPDLLVPKINQAEEAGGVYRPPMMLAASMDEEEGAKERRRKERAAKDATRRAQSSTFVRELAAEVEGRPEEVQDVIGAESQSMLRERARLQRRMEAEEELMARVPLSREERKRLKHMKNRPANGLLGMLDDFDDDVAGIVEMDDTGGAPAFAARPSGRKLSQAIAEAGRPAKKVSFASGDGDADLPRREDLGERRRKHEMHHARASANGLDSDEDGSGPESGGEGEGAGGRGRAGRRPVPEEDEVYREARELRAAKLAAKADKYARKESIVPQEEEVVEGKRGITYQIAKNRGLTPHRKKLTKNPRKKYKLKFGKAVVRRKGQVRDIRSRAAPYGGEETGIKANISRSVRFTKN